MRGGRRLLEVMSLFILLFDVLVFDSRFCADSISHFKIGHLIQAMILETCWGLIAVSFLVLDVGI